MQTLFTLSVHDVVDALLRTGSIDTRLFNSEAMQEGTLMHKRVQEAAGPGYLAEVPLETTFDAGRFVFDIQGKADGVISQPDGTFIVDEIKTTVGDLASFKEENFAWHQGQAKMYAWMLARSQKVSPPVVRVRVSYFRQHRMKEKLVIDEDFSFDALDSFATSLLMEFASRLTAQMDHAAERNRSLEGLSFPFPSFRTGQKDLIAFADRMALQKGRGYALAPTGIGKTACVLYSFVQSLKRNEGEGIYYLTSKNSIKRQALLTVRSFNEQGADLRCVAITAKETICLNPPGAKKHCNPDECPYAVNYYGKVFSVIREALAQKKVFDTQDIVELAEKHTVCPFELSLDLSKHCDLCIYDYNYVYDPMVQNPLIKNTTLPLPFLLLVDEAHNLPSRAREMYSSTLSRQDFEALSEHFKGRASSRLKSAIVQVESWFDQQTSDRENEVVKKVPEDFSNLLKEFVDEGNNFEKKMDAVYPDSYVSLKNAVRGFLELPQGGKENYAYSIAFRQGRAEAVHILCLDASSYIRDITARFTSALFFSATLSPEDYYLRLLGASPASEGTEFLKLPSPFETSNRLVVVDTASSLRYRDRESSFPEVLNAIFQMVQAKEGNYFLFFPSYEYMLKSYEKFESLGRFECLRQERNMSLEQREEFLEVFDEKPAKTRLGFLVLGGIFAEGIELRPHALSGVAVVSVGLPGIGFAQSQLEEYYDKVFQDGFDYAYTYPGFNKVIQAAGRVIRDEGDRGVILLLDQRFASRAYRRLLSDVFPDRIEATSPQEVGDLARRFWKKRS